MASRIKGITVEIGGDTTGLEKALKSVNSTIRNTQSELKDVNRLLKLDPSNTELLAQKQAALKEAIDATKDKLETLKTAQEQAKQQLENGDLGQDKYDALQREIAETEQDLRSLEQEYKNFGSVAAQQIAVVGEKMKDVGSKMSEVGESLTKYVTLPIVGAGTAAATKFAEVDKTMQLTNATMDNSAEEAALLDKAMSDAAANSTFGMKEAADATLNFARAGLDAQQAADALAPAMNLAAGEGGNLDTVSAGLVATINGFQDSFENAGAYADIFAAACNNSALDVNSISSSMSTAAPVFNAAGYSVRDAALYMGTMANNGIDANTAANALKTGLARLIEPAKEGQEWLDRLNLSVSNADGSMKDSITVQHELHDAFAGLSESEQIAAASAIFGKNQMSNWLALINSAPEDVDKLADSLDNAKGTTDEMSEAMMGGFGGSIEKLKSSLDVLMTSLGKLVAQYLQPLINKIQKAVDKFNGLDDKSKKIIVTIAGIVAAIGPLLVVGGKLVTGIGMMLTFAPAIVGAIGAISPVVLIVIGVIAALVAIGVTLYKNWDTIRAKASEVKENISASWDGLKMKLSDTWENIKTKASSAWESIKSTTVKKAGELNQELQPKLDAIRSAYEENGGGILGVASATAETMHQIWETKLDILDSLTGGKLSEIWGVAKEKFNNIVQSAKEAWNNLKTNTQNMFNSIREFISNAVSRVRGLFNFHWSWPHIALPHFQWSWQQIGKYISVPYIWIEWYKKAYENPVLFNSPTVVNTPSGPKGFGDGKGGEVVLGMEKLKELVGASGDITINVYAPQGMDVNELAEKVQTRLVALQKQRSLAYGT